MPPLRSWPISLVLGLAAGTVIRGVSLGGLVLGLALTTTALGSILPILGDAGILGTRFGGQIMAIGAVGEFGPVVAVALLLTSDEPLRTSLLLAAFAVITAAAGLPRTPARRTGKPSGPSSTRSASGSSSRSSS